MDIVPGAFREIRKYIVVVLGEVFWESCIFAPVTYSGLHCFVRPHAPPSSEIGAPQDGDALPIMTVLDILREGQEQI